jgi:Uma2 family endonuclease
MGAAEIIEYYTYDDYKHWEGDWELIGGVAYAMAPSPYVTHQGISAEIFMQIRNSMRCENCFVVYEEDWKINEYTVLKPDIVLICNERSKKFITKTPLLIVEIISKTSAKRDEEYKFEIYEEEKVPYYILIYPEELKAKIYKLKNDKYSKEGDFLDESYEFNEIECKPKIDFEEVFKRFRD